MDLSRQECRKADTVPSIDCTSSMSRRASVLLRKAVTAASTLVTYLVKGPRHAVALEFLRRHEQWGWFLVV